MGLGKIRFWASGAAVATAMLLAAGLTAGSLVQAQGRDHRGGDRGGRAEARDRGGRGWSGDRGGRGWNRDRGDRGGSRAQAQTRPQRDYRVPAPRDRGQWTGRGQAVAPPRNNGWRNGDRGRRDDGDRYRGGRDGYRYWDRDNNRWVYRAPYYGGGNYYGGPYYYGGGYTGSYGYGYGSSWEAKGYHDGLDRGREDARTNRYPDPNNSEHFRNGNPAYREGFARGYEVGFREYAGRYRPY